MKLTVKIPVWGIKPGEQLKDLAGNVHTADHGGHFYQTADGLMIRAFSQTEARSFCEGLGHHFSMYPSLAGEMEVEVDVPLTAENRAALVDALIDDIIAALNKKYAAIAAIKEQD